MENSDVRTLAEWLKNTDLSAGLPDDISSALNADSIAELNALKKDMLEAMAAKAAINALPTPICIKNRDLTAVFSNEAYAKLDSQSCLDELGEFGAYSISSDKALREIEKSVASQPAGMCTEIDASNNPLKHAIWVGIAGQNGSEYVVEQFRDDTDLNAMQELVDAMSRQLSDTSQLDSLTGVDNEQSSMRRLENFVGNHKRYDESFSLILVDIDKLKELNACRGYSEGNRALQQVAVSIRKSIRNGDFVGRIHEDQFMVIIKEHGQSTGSVVSERIRAGIESLEARIGFRITASVGAVSHKVTESAIATLNDAKTALQKAKLNGGNRTVAD